MENFTNGSGQRFWQGLILGFIGWTGLLFHSGIGYWLDNIIKMIGSSMLAGATGLATMLASDFYKHKIRNRLFKNKKDKDNDKEKAA